MQAGSQASTSLPPGEGSNPPQTGRKAVRQAGGLLPSGERSNLYQAGSQASTSQATAHLLSGEGSSSSQATALRSPGKVSSISQAIAHLPSGKGSNSPQATAHLPPSEVSSISQAIVHLPSGEGSNSPLVTAHLPPEEGSSSSQSSAHPPPGQGNSSLQAGQSNNQARSVRQGSRSSTRHRAPRLPRRIALSPRKTPLPLPPSRPPQGSSNEEPNPMWVINLSNKPLTLAQRSVLAKGPNFEVTPRQPPNLEYITAIEAACTKLSQQDAEELRADINRVLRSSHPPNLT